MTEHLIPVSYFPAPTQDVHAMNERRIWAKPYARFFDGRMFLPAATVPALSAPMDPADAIASSPAGLASLLDPGHHAVETGYCVMADGTAYVASRTYFPGSTGAMLAWWFWWFMVENERYSLWHPYSKVSVEPADRRALDRPGLTHEQRYVGTTIRGTEYIGPDLVKVKTRLVRPRAWGLDTERFEAAGIVASVLGEIALGPLHVGKMLRLARKTEDGFELRSRFWIGDKITLTARRGAHDLSPLLRRLGVKSKLIDASTAYEQLYSDQVGMTHLAGFLPEIHRAHGE